MDLGNTGFWNLNVKFCWILLRNFVWGRILWKEFVILRILYKNGVKEIIEENSVELNIEF